MFSNKRHLGLCSGFYLLLVGLLFAGLATAVDAGAQTSQAINYNPRQLDTQKIMGAFQQNYSDLTLISAHRGVHALAQLNQAPNVPENSLEAIEWAAREGYEAIEVDVRLTSDGQAVLTHDKSWGREWCGSSYPVSDTVQIFDPFAPNTGNNQLANPVVVNTPYSYVARPRYGTVLRDSVSLVTDTADHGCTFRNMLTGEWPPTLDQVYTDIRSKGIKAVLMIDVQSPEAALAAWNVVQANKDSDGNDAYQSTIFKLPADMFSNYETDFLNVFQINYYDSYKIHWIPVITTRYVAPTASTATLNVEDGGVDVSAVTDHGFGSETNINHWVDVMVAAGAQGHSGQIMAVEVVMKENQGILSSVLAHVGAMNNQFGFPMMVGNFHPAGEYYPFGATQEPQYFRSSDGTCCDYLEAYLYNNPNSKYGVTDPGGPQDNSDIRRSFPFLFRTGVKRTSLVTTDDPFDAAQYLDQQRNQRNWKGHLVANGVTIASNAVVLSLGALERTANMGDVVHLLAGLSDDLATGSVTFMDGGTTLASVPLTGQSAAYNITETIPGDHSYTAMYSGDSTFSATYSNSFTVVVSSGTTSMPTPSTCDIYASGDTPCVAAHSTVRALFGDYSGKLYQVKRASDGTARDIGTLATGGYADAALQDSFCTGTTCAITIIYDQTSNQNDLPVTPGDSLAVANALPIKANGNRAYGLQVTRGVGYRNNATRNVATGASPEGMYMVTSGTFVNRGCCFDYGNAETNSQDNHEGHMDALNFGTYCEFTCSGNGPWVEADLEDGQYMGNGTNLADVSMGYDFVTAMLKNNGTTTFALKGGNAQSGGLIADYSGSLPTTKPGYIPMKLEGAIILGTGGDNSDGDIGAFFEGAMTSGYPTDATESAVQANIVAAGYTGDSSGGSVSIDPPGTYTGQSDPNGPGPQDGFASPAAEQPNDIMATKPSLASFNGSLYLAFEGVNVNNDLYVTSSSTGNNFPTATQYTNIQSSSAPALAAFNNQLFMAFRGLNVDNDFYITSSPTGDNFPTATRYTNIQMGGAPALAEFNYQLCAAFQANDPSHILYVTCSSDGVNWPTATGIPNVWVGSDPAMASFNGKLYIAYRANDSSRNVWIASSSDGVNFSNQQLTGQTMGGSSSPALVVSNGILYYIYGANDQGHEMLVSASTDGSTWQGPAAYLGVQMGATGPAAAAFGSGVSVGFQSNDSRNVLFVTNKVTEAASYTGPSDPGGPGPQDGLASPATEQPNDIMATKPALASFNGNLYVAFEGVNVNNDLYVTSSSTGNNFPTATQYTNIQTSSAPALAAFGNKLYMAFRGLNVDNDFYITSSQTGNNFPTATRYTNIQMGGAPALAKFNSKLCAAFQANDPGHTLHVTCSSDGVTWPTATQIPNVRVGSDPAMASFNGKLYIAYRADDPSNNVWIASSSDGVNFSNQMIGQTMGGSSSPALAVSNCTLYLIYGANDQGNEMMVMASSDGSNWQGPKAYLGVQLGATGPAATAFAHGVSVGFQSNDARNVLFVTNGADGTAFSSGSCQAGTLSTGTLLGSSVSYPRVVRLSHGSSSVNGQIIANSNDDIYRSTDGGKTFNYLDSVPVLSGSQQICCATLFELPQAVGQFPAGTLLFAGTYYINTLVVIEVYESEDQGASWYYVATPVGGGNVNGGGGLWEPAFEIANNGELVMFWSDESDPCCSQKIAQIMTTDLFNWPQQTNTVASQYHVDRPGMATVSKLPNGLYFMSYEICGPAGCTVYSRTSTDGWNFGTPSDLGTRVATATGQYFEHAPTNVWTPVTNTVDGAILLIGQVMLESNNQISTQNGEAIFVNYNNGSGPWYAGASPIQVPDARDNPCPNYSSVLLPSLDGSSLLELATDYNASGQCETYFATTN